MRLVAYRQQKRDFEFSNDRIGGAFVRSHFVAEAKSAPREAKLQCSKVMPSNFYVTKK